MPYLTNGGYIREETIEKWGELDEEARDRTRPKILEYARRGFELCWPYFDRPAWLTSLR